MIIWFELGIFLLAFVFAAWQFHDLKKARAERIAREKAQPPRLSPSATEAGLPSGQDAERQPGDAPAGRQ